ncbi:MAG: hypothetical protein ACE15C_10100 [Phycisphaerae bacterium]
MIAFEVDKPCDVTVRIVDPTGKVVRNLAAGMVGLEKAAKPLAAKSLKQTIAWDGKDDAGKEAPAGCKVSVAVGMGAKFDRFIIWEKDACPRSRANCYYVAPDGQCYVNQSTGTHVDTLRVFDAQGKLVREAWPPSLNKPKEALQRLIDGQWGATDWDGDAVPIKVCYNSWYLFGVRTGSMARTSDGYLVGVFMGVGQGLYCIGPDDFPVAMSWRPAWFVSAQSYKTKLRLAAGVDGDFYLADDYQHVVGRFRAKDMAALDSFTHNGKDKLDKPRYHIGEIGKAGADEGHFTGPNDVAVDADGNLCILDGDKVKVYSKSGEFIKSADKGAFPAARPIPQAVKDTEKTTRALCFPTFLKARADGRLLIINAGAEAPAVETDIDGKDPKVRQFGWACQPYHGYAAYDAEGNWYAAMTVPKQPQQIWKYGPDGKRARFGQKDAIILQQEDDPFILSKGVSVAANGDIYVVVQRNKWATKAPDQTGGVKFGDLSARGADACQTRVDIYGQDGVLKAKGVVKSVGINDVALDRDGNIYIIDGTMWHGAQMGAVAKGESVYGKKHWPFAYLTEEQAKLDPKTQSNKRYSLLCRLVKFSPEGGILDDASGKGQLWDYAGVSGVSPWNCDAECPAAQICIDPDERLWVPDSFMYCVKAVDKAGNEIIRVGKYGNEDCRGGGGDKRHPEMKNVVIDPEIPLAYPKGIAVHGDWLFISDMFAHRVMRCRLVYADAKQAAAN